MKFVMIAMLAIGFTSCGKDDPKPETIIGKWIKIEYKCDKPYDKGDGASIVDHFAVMDEKEQDDITEFTKDGKVLLWADEKDDKGQEIGTYTLEDKLLVMKYINEAGNETSATEYGNVTLKDNIVTMTEEINKASTEGVVTYTFTIKYKKVN